MNLVILCGRLTREPEVKTTANGTPMVRYTLAVDRRKKDEENSADFINILSFGSGAEFAGNYFHQGMRVLVQGRIQTGSYINRDGQKVNTFDIVTDYQEFADGKQEKPKKAAYNRDEFISVPEDQEYGIPF